MRWLANSYGISFKWTATAGIEIHLTKAWLSQLVHLKIQYGREEERYEIKFCFKLGKKATETYGMLQTALRDFKKRFLGKRPALFKSGHVGTINKSAHTKKSGNLFNDPCIYIYIYIHISSSCRAISTDFPDPLSPPLPIVHCFRQVFRTTSHIYTEWLHIGSSWSFCICSAVWKGPR